MMKYCYFQPLFKVNQTQNLFIFYMINVYCCFLLIRFLIVNNYFINFDIFAAILSLKSKTKPSNVQLIQFYHKVIILMNYFHPIIIKFINYFQLGSFLAITLKFVFDLKHPNIN